MADELSASTPLNSTAEMSSTACTDKADECRNCSTGANRLELDQPQQLLTPSIAIPLPPPPSLNPCSLEIPRLLTKTVESESQTDDLLENSNNSNNCRDSGPCNQVVHGNGNDLQVAEIPTPCGKVIASPEGKEQPEFYTSLRSAALVSPDFAGSEDTQPDDQKSCGNELSSEHLDEAEVSLVQIHDKLIDPDALQAVADSSESEEDDQLKPLIVDNHQECYLAKRQIQKIIHHNLTMMKESNGANDSSRLFSECNYAQNLYQRQPHLVDSACDSSDIQSSDETNSRDNKNDALLADGVKEIDTLAPEEIADDRMAEEIVEQVEYYFSNDNILKDAFLLKHVRRNKEGFVSLKLVSSFKRVRQLTKDWRVVGDAIRRKSRSIELNDVGTKIRRLEPLPTFDETMPSRTIVVCDLPVDKLCIERVSDIFSKCGEIALIRILRPGAGIPVDVRQFMNKYPEMQAKECALVEFTESNSARNAQNMEGPFKVFEMVAPKKKTGKKAITVTKLIENYKYGESNYERNRGGVAIPQPQSQALENDFKYKLRRNNSDFYAKPDHTHICTQRKYSYNPNNSSNGVLAHSPSTLCNYAHSAEQQSFMHYPRRASNFSVASSENLSRRYSSCSDGYSSCSEFSRRPSGASSATDSRRTSNCSDYCLCTRRGSHGSNIVGSPNMNLYNSELIFRRMSSASTSSQHGGMGLSPEFNSDMGRRMSADSNGGVNDRKLSTGSNGSNDRQIIHDSFRKFSNGFDPNRKLSNGDQYFNGRRLSTDSGYDRRMSFGSDYGSSPRSRSGSFLTCQQRNSEAVVRTPIGPDGSKGFISRARKVGQTVSPV